MIRRVIGSSALLLFTSLLPGCGRRVSDVIFLPTAADLTDPLLDLASVTSDDLVADLGCGDGRIVIRAAQRVGARGLCVEIDPGLVARSRAAADTAGVTLSVSASSKPTCSRRRSRGSPWLRCTSPPP